MNQAILFLSHCYFVKERLYHRVSTLPSTDGASSVKPALMSTREEAVLSTTTAQKKIA